MDNNIRLIRIALEEHLNSINENSQEIQALFDYLQDTENRISSIENTLKLLNLSSEKKYSPLKLNETEKKLFQTIYSEDKPLDYQEISDLTSIPLSTVPDCISSLVNKGIPLNRSYINKKLFIGLERQFKDVQMRENILNLGE